MNNVFKTSLAICVFILLGACSSLPFNLEDPTVKITSLGLGEPTGINQSFKIGLAISNPNAKAIPVIGMKYTLSLNGFDLISGVTNNIPTLAAYEETAVTLNATANLVEALRLVNSITKSTQTGVSYRLTTKLDLKGWPLPLTLREEGKIGLDQ